MEPTRIFPLPKIRLSFSRIICAVRDLEACAHAKAPRARGKRTVRTEPASKAV